jgi:hypothetical protein
MWAQVITGSFLLAGTILGAFLEPLRGLFTSRARTRQLRGERCATFIHAVTTSRHGIVEMNAVDRLRAAGGPEFNKVQVRDHIRKVNEARAQVRETAALLRMFGPDELANQAEAVREAETALYRVIEEPTVDGADPREAPPKVAKAAEAVDVALASFAVTARDHTR